MLISDIETDPKECFQIVDPLQGEPFDASCNRYIYSMKNSILLLLTLFCVSCTSSLNIGKPFNDKKQHIPGRMECEYFDVGGEGVAYHDTDSLNNGSGKLNPANGNFLNEFRMKEGVDISYTKTREIDNNPYKTIPDSNQLYIGWTLPGQWINYTVQVNETAVYWIGSCILPMETVVLRSI